ncbi:MAG: hydroxylamine oxidoreductase, partial [Desulfobacterales bacterium]
MRKSGVILVSALALTGFLAAGFFSTQALAANVPKAKEFRIERAMPKEATACIECHKIEHPGLFADWANSRHASANI